MQLDPDLDLRLYVLMRTDIPQMNPGKAMAQAAHSANMCIVQAPLPVAFNTETGIDEEHFRLVQQIEEWASQTPQGFGTTIVLGVTEEQMRVRVRMAQDGGHHAGIVHDPTFPLAVPERTDPLGWPAAMLSAVVMLALDHPMIALFLSAVGTVGWLMGIVGQVRRDREPATVPMDTCAFIFGPRNAVKGCLVGLKLHP